MTENKMKSGSGNLALFAQVWARLISLLIGVRVTMQWRTLALALLLLNLYEGLSVSYLFAFRVGPIDRSFKNKIGADFNSIISQLRPERHSRHLGREIASVRKATRSLPTFVGSDVEADGRIAGVRRGGLLRCLMMARWGWLCKKIIAV